MPAMGWFRGTSRCLVWQNSVGQIRKLLPPSKQTKSAYVSNRRTRRDRPLAKWKLSETGELLAAEPMICAGLCTSFALACNKLSVPSSPTVNRRVSNGLKLATQKFPHRKAIFQRAWRFFSWYNYYYFLKHPIFTKNLPGNFEVS